MQEQARSTPDERQAKMIDQAIMDLLLSEYRGLWKAPEIECEIGDPVAVQESLDRLYGAGLIHQLDEFVFPTVAAVARASEGRLQELLGKLP